MASSVRLIFESVANVEERSAGNGDDRRIAHVQFLCRASVKREFRSRPTENGIANLEPLRFRWYFTDYDPRLIAGRTKVAVRFSFDTDDPTVTANHFSSSPVHFDCGVRRATGPGQLNISEGVTACIALASVGGGDGSFFIDTRALP